ncbi:MAG TPA: FAD-dependent oxidoreductase, partial [Cellulomonas sp.]
MSDLAIVGAGPAGLAAAVAAAARGLSVTVVDAGRQPGGQYWRHPDEQTSDPDD